MWERCPMERGGKCMLWSWQKWIRSPLEENKDDFMDPLGETRDNVFLSMQCWLFLIHFEWLLHRINFRKAWLTVWVSEIKYKSDASSASPPHQWLQSGHIFPYNLRVLNHITECRRCERWGKHWASPMRFYIWEWNKDDLLLSNTVALQYLNWGWFDSQQGIPVNLVYKAHITGAW